MSGKQPLTHFLYLCEIKKPDKNLAPLEQNFIQLALSKQVQQMVIKDG
ncbi:MAG: hypothetical protein KAH20_08185 [Methylococcales bacterium]|nr:hypothetical protein [Methylococcales bacterium]